MKNIAQTGRRELEAHRRWVVGVTASEARYEVVDVDGAKEWVIDVYVGPLEHVTDNIVKSCLIASYARELVADAKQPVLLERSKQGKYTVVGRTSTMPAGVVFDSEVTEPSFELVRDNLATLRLRFLPDLDWELEPFGGPGKKFRSSPDKPFQIVRAFDAFGVQMVGPEAAAPEEIADGSMPRPPGGGAGYSPAAAKGALYAPAPASAKTSKHTAIYKAKFGPKGDPDAMSWGVSVFRPTITKTILE